MNNLKRTIQPKEIVIIQAHLLKPEYWADRRFQVEDGYGMSAITIGSALFGTWLVDGERCRMDGAHIDVADTNLFQALCWLAFSRLVLHHYTGRKAARA